jgi:carotenoid 1,2-hydratase
LIKPLGFAVTLNNGPDFSVAVAKDGYCWWYVDAFSDDGQHGLTMIAFVGSVFSPYYASARRKGRGDPEHHCAINVALYGRGGKRWALTERGRGDLVRSESELRVGPSGLSWNGTDLVIDVDEMTVPFPGRLKGQIRVSPIATVAGAFTLAEGGRHQWRPIAPICRVELSMSRPGLNWTGHGYFDTNSGETPLETTFEAWDWSRASTSDTTTIFYDGQRRHEGPFNLAIAIARDGSVATVAAPPRVTLPTTAVWRIPRQSRSDASNGNTAGIIKTFEDTPFYARSKAELLIDGKRLAAMHESLLLDRFAARWVQTLLPFRMPRIARDRSSASL